MQPLQGSSFRKWFAGSQSDRDCWHRKSTTLVLTSRSVSRKNFDWTNDERRWHVYLTSHAGVQTISGRMAVTPNWQILGRIAVRCCWNHRIGREPRILGKDTTQRINLCALLQMLLWTWDAVSGAECFCKQACTHAPVGPDSAKNDEPTMIQLRGTLQSVSQAVHGRPTLCSFIVYSAKPVIINISPQKLQSIGSLIIK